MGVITTCSCKDCDGTGISPHGLGETIFLPPYTRDNNVIPYIGLGRKNKELNIRGDLLVTVKVDKHPFLNVRGDDLLGSITVGFDEACLGCTKTVRGIAGEQYSIEVNPIAAKNGFLSIANAGMVSGNVADKHSEDYRRGNLVIKINIRFPNIPLTSKHIEALELWKVAESN